MKFWSIKFLNSPAGYGEPLRSKTSHQKIEQALKQRRPNLEAPPDLHGSIMAAVAANAHNWSSTRRRSHGESGAVDTALIAARKSLAWLALPATALLAVLVAWPIVQHHRAAGSIALHPAVFALQAGDQMTSEMPAKAVAPLEEELERLNQDIEGAEQLLVASLP